MADADHEKDSYGLIVERDTKFTSGTVVLDGHYFINCQFVDCELVYGGGPYMVEGTHTPEKCDLVLSGPAALTMDLLKWLKINPMNFHKEKDQ